MFSRIVFALALAATGMASLPAFADDDYASDDHGDYAYARVVDVEPRMRMVRVSMPHQECYTDTRYVAVERPDSGPMILGGLVGAVIGHQLGSGHARGLGTLAGAVIGGAIGRDAGRYRDHNEGDARPVQALESERCETRYDQHYEQQVDGYLVRYRYDGRTYETMLHYNPGDRLRVRVNVSPVE
jgi:uncharacterized protein YcfJ